MLLTDSFYTQFDGGNSAQGTGYAALFPQMIADWRAIWSAVPGTTDPLAPFGFVTLADGTDEAWGLSMAGLRMAQMGSFETVPNPAMPNTFMALGHDAGDPWDDDSCGDRACCVDPYIALGSTCEGDHRGQWSVNGTGWFMGQVHPRAKGVIGRRLAQAAFATVYGGQVPAQGPVLSGCSLSGATLTITLNTSMGEKLTWAEGASVAAENTFVRAARARAAAATRAYLSARPPTRPPALPAQRALRAREPRRAPRQRSR